jgi:hypothetical protein
MSDITFRTPVSCLRCDRDVFWVGQQGRCKGCLIETLAPRSKSIFNAVRYLGRATDSMLAERHRMSVGDVQLILEGLADLMLVELVEIAWKEKAWLRNKSSLLMRVND